jgi:hypothetical protein
MLRRTKILATLGPASNDAKVLKKMIKAGVDVVRLNFSHGVAQDHIRRAELVRQCAAEVGRPVGILVDLQGPKIRIDKFANGPITLNEGDAFILDVALDSNAGTQERVGVTYKDLPKDVVIDNELLLDDGRLVLKVTKVQGNEIHTVVTVAGVLSNNKDHRLVEHVVFDLAAKGGIEDFFLDHRVNLQLGADFFGDLTLAILAACILELVEQVGHFVVIGAKQHDGVGKILARHMFIASRTEFSPIRLPIA